MVSERKLMSNRIAAGIPAGTIASLPRRRRSLEADQPGRLQSVEGCFEKDEMIEFRAAFERQH